MGRLLRPAAHFGSGAVDALGTGSALAATAGFPGALRAVRAGPKDDVVVAIQDSGANPGPFRHRGPIRAHSSGCRAAGCEDGIPGAMSCRPIDKFAENVSTAKEVSPLSNHMDQNLMQGGMAPLLLLLNQPTVSESCDPIHFLRPPLRLERPRTYRAWCL